MTDQEGSLTHYRLVPYDPRWPAMFTEKKARILAAVGTVIRTVEHIGSTAVPGLMAKPVIDMIGSVRSLSDFAQCVQPLAGIGYEYRPWQLFTKTDPGRRYFRKGPPGRNTHHLSLVEHPSSFWNDHMLFRDYLRAHPKAANEYLTLKKELLERYGLKGDPVVAAKTTFVEHILDLARQ